MSLSYLDVSNFRNFSKISFNPCPEINVIHGENGSGKTSLLEAIYYLGFGRSFRTRFSDQIIKYHTQQFTLFGHISNFSTGIERTLDGDFRIKINDEEIKSASVLANNLPLQLINSETYALINAGPKNRRQFIDYGVFHVEHLFLDLWRKAEKVLKQRNAALKTADFSHYDQVILWDDDFIALSEAIQKHRSNYIEAFKPIFSEVLYSLLDIQELKIDFFSGWPSEKSLSEWMKSSLKRDIVMGFTQYGPHRAELLVFIDGRPAQETLSRGQLKMLVCAMRIAQAILLELKHGRKTVFLIDDLPSELDAERRKRLCCRLCQLKTQIFVTGITLQSFERLFLDAETEMFHVEHGELLLPVNA